MTIQSKITEYLAAGGTITVLPSITETPPLPPRKCPSAAPKPPMYRRLNSGAISAREQRMIDIGPAIVDMWRSGVFIKDIAARLGHGTTTVMAALDYHGVTPEERSRRSATNGRPLNSKDVATVKAMIKKGLTVREIVAGTDMTNNQVRHMIRAHGLKINYEPR